MLWKCCTQYALKFGKLSSGHRTGKGVFIPVPKKGNAKESSNYHTTALISHASKVMLKILQAKLQQYVNQELPDVQAGFRKGRGTRSNCQHLLDHWKSKSARKTSISSSLTTLKPLCESQQTVEILKEMGIPNHYHLSPDLPAEKPICRSRSNSWNWTWNNRLVPNWEKSSLRLYIVTLLD